MAIKVSNIEIIGNDFEFKFLNGFEGKYDNLRAQTTNLTSSGIISFQHGFQTTLLTQDENMFFRRESKGETATVLLTTAGHTPIWPADELYWTNNSEPNWASYPVWLISFVCWGEGTVQGSATPYS